MFLFISNFTTVAPKLKVGAAWTQAQVLAKGGVENSAEVVEEQGSFLDFNIKVYIHYSTAQTRAGTRAGAGGGTEAVQGGGPPRGGDRHASPLAGDPRGANGLPRGRGFGCASGREPRVCRSPGAPGEVGRPRMTAHTQP